VVIEKKINFAKMNNKNSLLLVDPEFDPQAASDCTLLIKITTDSFSYAVLNKKINQLLVIFDYQECNEVMTDLSNRFHTDPYLSLGFKETKIAAHTPNSLSIPDDLYQEDHIDSYRNCFKTEVADVYTQSVPAYGLQLVFAQESFAASQLDTLFPAAKKNEHTAAALALTQALEGDVLLLDFTVSSCNIVFQKAGQLIFNNYFETEDSGEFNYYLVVLIKQLSIDPATTTVYLSGIIHDNDSKYACVQQYFNRLQFLTPFKDAPYELLENMPLHYYNSLLAIDLCE
jgi:hypothetical protein